MAYINSMLKRRILIVNDGRDCGASYSPFFARFGEVTNDVNALKLNPFNFKLVVFTGGSDVSPTLYGDTSPNNICCSSLERDIEEVSIYKFAQTRGIKMAGICRGMQFLNVMTGGKMMHDISGHNSGNHEVMVRDRDVPFLTNSFHHQMCIPHVDTHILGWSNIRLSKRYVGAEDEVVKYKGPEVEAIYMPWLKAVGLQWHPEAAPNTGLWTASASWSRFVINDLLEKTTIEFRKLYLGESYSLSIEEAK